MLRRALLPFLVLVLAGVAAPAAHAGSYTVSSCRAPDGGVAPTDGWVGGGRFPTADFCAGTERFLSLFGGSNSGGEGGQVAVYDFAAPDDTRIAGYTLWRSSQVSTKSANPGGSPPDTWSTVIFEYDARIDIERHADLCYGFQGCKGFGDVRTPLADANKFTRTGLPANTRHIQIQAGCAFGPCQPDNPQANYQVHRADMVLEDAVAPTLDAPPGGGLTDPGRVVTGTEAFTFAARDQGGGLERAIVEVDGREVAEAVFDDNGGACRRPFTRRVPCKLAAAGTVAYDLTQLPDGPHQVRLLVADTGGNRVASEPRTIVSRRPVTSCAAPQAGLRIDASFRRRGRSVRVRPGRGATVTGRMVDDAGAPIAGAPLRLLAREDRIGGPTSARDDVVTGADGRFSVRVRRGPSRRLRIAHRVGAEPELRCSEQLRLRVAAPVSIRLSRARLRAPGKVVVRGRLTGRPLPATGKLVELQAFDRGRWRTFTSTRARGDGRFAARLPFGRRARAGRYPIRARVRREATYPYAIGYSKVKRLTLR